MADDTITIHIGGESYELDDLTLREVADLEEAFGQKLEEIDLTGAKATAYIIWFAKRRKDETFTLDQALDLPITTLAEPNGGAKRPTKAAGRSTRGGSGARSSRGSTG